MARKQQSALFHQPGIEQLQSIVRMLNDPSLGGEIRRLVEAWNESGRSLLELWLKLPELQTQMSPARFFGAVWRPW